MAARAYNVTSADGQTHAVLPIRFLPAASGFYRHTVVEGDRLDLLAATYYGRPERFWLIADANAALDPEDLVVPGAEVVVPPDRTG